MRTIGLALAVTVLFATAADSAVAVANGTLFGEVRAPSGEGLGGATIVVRSAENPGKDLWRRRTSERGTFVFNLPPGDYKVSAYYGDWAVLGREVPIGPAKAARIRFFVERDDIGLEVPSAPVPGDRFAKIARKGRYSVGAETEFLDGDDSSFASLMILRPRARLLSEHAIYELSLDVLAKGPEVADDASLQSGSINATIALGQRGSTYVNLSGGRQRFGLGNWSSADVGGEWQRNFADFFAVSGKLGAVTTSLFNNDRGDQWIAEATAGTRLLFTLPCIDSMIWLGAELHAPLAHSGGLALDRKPVAGEATVFGELDPRTRLDVSLGFELGSIEDWDLHAEIGFGDRGDRDAVGTTLPILVGGGDQARVVFGMSKRFGGGE